MQCGRVCFETARTPCVTNEMLLTPFPNMKRPSCTVQGFREPRWLLTLLSLTELVDYKQREDYYVYIDLQSASRSIV